MVINNKNYDKFRFPNQVQSLDNELVECLLVKQKNLIMEKCLTLIYDGKNIKNNLKVDSDYSKEDLDKLEEA